MLDRPRRLRPVPPQLGLYLRAGRNDHRALQKLVAEGRADMRGLVLSAALLERHADLVADVHERGIETVLDPHTMELAMAGGITRSSLRGLPWGGEVLHSPSLLLGRAGEDLIHELVRVVLEYSITAVLAPTHYVQGPRDPWLQVDRQRTRDLRRALDRAGCERTLIYYPLIIHTKTLRDQGALDAMVRALPPIDGLWLRVHPFGASSGPHALRHYIRACRSLHGAPWPIVAEKTGAIGLALMAFGAVGGIESGITFGERFDAGPLVKPPTAGRPFSAPPRVYIARLGAFLTGTQAREFFQARGMKSTFACQVASCCRQGARSMLADPKRHFVLERVREVGKMSGIPERLRESQYLEDFLRPATDLALRATRVSDSLDPIRKRLEDRRHVLGALHRDEPALSFSHVPEGTRIDRRWAV